MVVLACVHFPTLSIYNHTNSTLIPLLQYSLIHILQYNLACTAGWAYCLYLCVTGYNAGKSAAELYVDLKDPLTVSIVEKGWYRRGGFGLLSIHFIISMFESLTNIFQFHHVVCSNRRFDGNRPLLGQAS